jgi:hypothetical protein
MNWRQLDLNLLVVFDAVMQGTPVFQPHMPRLFTLSGFGTSRHFAAPRNLVATGE